MIAQPIIRFFGRLPFRMRSFLGYWIGCIAGSLPLRDQRIASEQLKVFLQTPRAASLARQVFGHFGRLGFECFNLEPAVKNPESHIMLEDEELFASLMQAKEPIVAFTAHFGNWELLAAYMSSRGVQVVTVAREARQASLQTFLRNERTKFGVQTIWRGGVAAQKELIRALKEGKTIAALIDQDTRVSGAPSKFFGSFVQTPSALVELAKRHSSRIVTAFCYRHEDGRYRVRIAEIPTFRSVEETIQIYNERLEALIREYPEQWVWFHKRWRSQPDGKRLSSTEYLAFLSSQEVIR